MIYVKCDGVDSCFFTFFPLGYGRLDSQLAEVSVVKVLIVGDDKEKCRLTERALLHLVCYTHCVPSVENALEVMACDPPDLAIIYDQLPDSGSGITLARQLREIDFGGPILIVFKDAPAMEVAHLIAIGIINGFCLEYEDSRHENPIVEEFLYEVFRLMS